MSLTLKKAKRITGENLLRVLKKLPKLAEKYPYIKNEFSMNKYGVYNYLSKGRLQNCSAIGCLMGNSARIFEKEFGDDIFDKFGQFDYNLFGQKFFPYLYAGKYLFPNEPNQRWEYLFSQNWSDTKFNDFDSALNRVENLLKNDLECKKYDYNTNKIIN